MEHLLGAFEADDVGHTYIYINIFTDIYTNEYVYTDVELRV